MTEAPEIRVRMLRPGARLPLRASEDASGCDLYACIAAPVELGQLPTLVPTGIALEVPRGFDAQIRPRSGLARQGVLSTFGTLDADYRGELMVALYTTSPEVRHTVHHGDRIGQLVLAQLVVPRFVECDELSATVRGERGHGSTGR